MDPQKYKALFVSESREILSSFQNELLKFERQEAGREPIDALFRAAHSLKGMAAAMSYTGFADLAHAMEDLADHGRRTGTLPTEAVDLMLEGRDRLSALLDEVEANDEVSFDTEELIGRVRQQQRALEVPLGADAASAPAPKSASAHAPEPPISGANLTRVAVRFSPDSPAPQVRAFMLHRQLAQRAEVVELSPSLDELKAGRFPDRTLVLTVRVAPDKLDALLAQARVGTDVEQVDDLGPPQRRRIDQPSGEPEIGEAQRTVRVRTEILDEFIDSVGELLRARDRLRAVSEQLDLPELNEIADELVVLTKDLHERVMSARMTPLSLLTERLPRVVRDLARNSGRPVELSVEGADIELDRALLDELHAAVLHIVRNAVDHGHEEAEARAAVDKPAALSLVVRATRDRDHVLIEVEDDGRGIDPARLRARAVEVGLLDEARAQALSDPDAIELICAPGFSTAEQVTEVSGRGVGMDAVRSTVERLGGDLQIRSELGQGTRFTLRLPLTMAIIGVMLVESGDAVFAIPTNRVSHARDFTPAQLTSSCGESLVRIEGELLPFFDLGALLGNSDAAGPVEGTVVLVKDTSGVAAVRVDRIAGLQEVVVKPLGSPLASVDFLAGAALLADGRPTFVLDVSKLVRQEAAAA